MSSGSATPKEVMNERLAELRNTTLLADEHIVAQQMGDHGQGVVITDSRVMILKAGLTATGSINGQNVTAFKFDEIGVVNLRRGPMGAIVQIVGKQITANPNVRPPENMAIFSGEQKVKKLELLIEKLVSSSGIAVNRVDWIPETVPESVSTNSDIDPETETVAHVDDTAATQSCDQAETASVLVPKKPRAPRKKAVPAPVINTLQDDSIESSAADTTEKAEEVFESHADTIQAVQSDKPAEQETPINVIPVEPEKPAPTRGIQKRSLAEEIFAELSAGESDESESAPAVQVSKPSVVPVEKVEVKKPNIPLVQKVEIAKTTVPPAQHQPAPEVAKQSISEAAIPAIPVPGEEYGPNPRLSMLMRKNKPSAARVIAVFAILGLIMLAGLAILGRNSISNIAVTQKPSSPGKDISQLRTKLSEVSSYKQQLFKLVAGSNSDARRMANALSARDARTIGNTISVTSHERVLTGLQKLNPPMGLRTVQDSLESAVNERKTVATAISNALTGAGFIDPGKNGQRLNRANSRIQQAFGEVNMLEASLRRQANM